MIKYGSAVVIKKEFKNGFYEGCKGVALYYNGDRRYQIELAHISSIIPTNIDAEKIKIIVPEEYLTEI